METDTQFQGMKGVFSGESIFFLRAFAQGAGGTVFFDSYGAIKRLDLDSGEELVVDTGHVVAFTDGVEYSIGKVGGFPLPDSGWGRTGDEVQGSRPGVDSEQEYVGPG